jgi:hypothetical protein
MAWPEFALRLAAGKSANTRTRKKAESARRHRARTLGKGASLRALLLLCDLCVEFWVFLERLGPRMRRKCL